MAHEGIFATYDECLQKCGKDPDSTAVSEAYINSFCRQAEAYINVLCRYNYSDNYATLNPDVKYLLTEACSNLVGIYVVQWNMRVQPSIRVGEDIMNVNWARFVQCTNLLRDEKQQTFVKDA